MISVIISTFNEMDSGYLPLIISSFSDVKGYELIFVDGGSTDGTIEYVRNSGYFLRIAPGTTRAARLNAGIQFSQNERLLFHHPRSVLSPKGLNALQSVQYADKWGGFRHRFDFEHAFLRYISWYSNHIRLDKKGIVYLDHCIYCHQKHLRGELIPDIDIFEDTELSKILHTNVGMPVMLNETATTSSVRFLRNGIYKQYAMNTMMKIGYYLGVAKPTLNRIYERGLSLNQRY